MKSKIFITIAIILSILVLVSKTDKTKANDKPVKIWQVQSIDTMKYSRDLSRQMLDDTSFDETIKEQITNIASTGATHVAIATPYDEEFTPILTRWVNEARRQNLNVWFRGNFSGWEGWFDYDNISRQDHLNFTRAFILNNPTLFVDGDIFTSCPECENGGPGDPRMEGDKEGFQQFMIESFKVSDESFKKIGKKVDSNYFSMNGDVANLVMDRETTKALNGIVVIDHYVKTPEKMIADIKKLAEKSGGKIVIGEFGAPIPDIHGNMTEQQQADWLEETLQALYKEESVVGLNYWTSKGGSTELWGTGNKAKLAVQTLQKYFDPQVLEVMVVDELDRPISQASVKANDRTYETNKEGLGVILKVTDIDNIAVSKDGYKTREIDDIEGLKMGETVTLEKENPSMFFRITLFFKSLFR